MRRVPFGIFTRTVAKITLRIKIRMRNTQMFTNKNMQPQKLGRERVEHLLLRLNMPSCLLCWLVWNSAEGAAILKKNSIVINH